MREKIQVPTTEQVKKMEMEKEIAKGNIMKVFSVNDRKTGFQNLMLFKTEGAAIRAFAFACKNPQNDFAKFPIDYELCEVGEFNIDEGVLIGKKTKAIGLAIDYIEKGE